MFEDSVSSVDTIWASMNSWLTPTVLFLLLNLMIAAIFITSTLTSQDPNQNQNNHRQQRRLRPVLQKLNSFNFSTYRAQEPTTHLQKSPAEPDEHVEQQQPEPHLARSPSMLQKLISINFYNHLAPAQSQNQNFANPEPTTTRLDFKQEQEQHIEWSDSEEEESQDQVKREDVRGVGDQSMDDGDSQLKNGGSGANSEAKPSNGDAPPKMLKKSASANSIVPHIKEDDIVESRRPGTVREGKAKPAEAETAEEFDAKADEFINKFNQQLKMQRLDSATRYKEMIERGAGQ
ncbi:pathogen-associated molecular patterns-induced protein A70-like [Humulus lupulus]|uniref:pathogen-associated molecular patterns-induced protein A70-like n=1 Tax=Humulus lupulus TaxID=3486 RepID=UPI002B40A2A1|nr:pathogen-associated molecular patterns-induced protein A70-like [Humulus lupulus]XP_062098909.1 pathogen-associated molecular patterns-induced protein A70-like [Humulus lupulus]